MSGYSYYCATIYHTRLWAGSHLLLCCIVSHLCLCVGIATIVLQCIIWAGYNLRLPHNVSYKSLRVATDLRIYYHVSHTCFDVDTLILVYSAIKGTLLTMCIVVICHTTNLKQVIQCTWYYTTQHIYLCYDTCKGHIPDTDEVKDNVKWPKTLQYGA